MQPCVIGNGLVLNLFDCMPAPQCGSFCISSLQMLWIFEQLAGKDGGEMFERHGRGQVDDCRARLDQFKDMVDLRI